MIGPLLLNLSNARQFLGQDLNNFTSAISYNSDYHYYFYGISFRLPKTFITLKRLDKLYYQMLFGNIESPVDYVEFNFECKCLAEKGKFEMVVFKPWCKD